MIQLHIHISLFKFFSHSGYYRILNSISSAIHCRYLLIIYFKYSSVYMSIPNPQSVLRILPPLKPQVCSLSLWISFWFVNRFIWVIFQILHIKNIIWYLSLSDLYDNLQIHWCCCKWHYFISFNGCVIFLCIYEPHLYPVICQWKCGCIHVFTILNSTKLNIQVSLCF